MAMSRMVVFLCILVGWAGCQGGPQPEPPEKDDFPTRAKALCGELTAFCESSESGSVDGERGAELSRTAKALEPHVPDGFANRAGLKGFLGKLALPSERDEPAAWFSRPANVGRFCRRAKAFCELLAESLASPGS